MDAEKGPKGELLQDHLRTETKMPTDTSPYFESQAHSLMKQAYSNKEDSYQLANGCFLAHFLFITQQRFSFLKKKHLSFLSHVTCFHLMQFTNSCNFNQLVINQMTHDLSLPFTSSEFNKDKIT